MSEFKTASTEAMDEFEAIDDGSYTDDPRLGVPITNWRPMVFVDGSWVGNGLVFATKAEAEASAKDLMYRWTSVLDSHASPTSNPVNYKWIEGRLVPVETKASLADVLHAVRPLE